MVENVASSSGSKFTPGSVKELYGIMCVIQRFIWGWRPYLHYNGNDANEFAPIHERKKR